MVAVTLLRGVGGYNHTMARTILVIDDERNMRWVLERALTKAGYDVVTAERGEQGIQQFALYAVDLVLLDLKMPGMDGMTVLRELRRQNRAVPILLLTAYATVPTAVEALRIGANDYLRKPFDVETVLATVNRYLAEAENRPAADPILSGATAALTEFVGIAASLQPALQCAQTAQQMPYPVILRGESGSGRRHLARSIHHGAAATAGKRLVELDCANLPPAVLAHELLAKADSDQPGGRWQQALGGSLLLSNVEALPAVLAGRAVQLLRPYLLSSECPHGLRLLITTFGPLAEAWQAITDLAFDIALPPLRARREDIPLLVSHFVPGSEWERDALVWLQQYDWPGNVFALQRVVQQIASLAGDGPVTTAQVPSWLQSPEQAVAGVFVLPSEGINLDEVEEDLIRQALDMAAGNKAHAARLLGLTRATFLYRLDKYKIDLSEPDHAENSDQSQQ